ncbi:MAG TPA: LytR C-terminal domain-containing protein [Jatrophihabitans sp.]|nr:LytR C-terminal domain-containing protein [Jatrophihabitans sp.]
MAHSAPPSTPPRRKLEVVLGIVGLLVGVALFALTVVALNHPKGQSAAEATATNPSASRPATNTSRPVTSPAVPSRSAAPSSSGSGAGPTTSAAGVARLPLIVLNNTSSTSADQAAARFQAGGWTVTDTSTFSGDILSTCVYYDANAPGAQQAAAALQEQFPAIKRVKPKFDGLPSGPLVVVLTSDYS